LRQVVDRVNDWIYNKFMQCIKRWTMEAREELKKLRESTGMNRKEFCEYFEIPYMTETDWELGNRRVPQYLLRLMAYKIEIEKLANKKKENDQEDEAT
jgi:putative transcriptional regulator